MGQLKTTGKAKRKKQEEKRGASALLIVAALVLLLSIAGLGWWFSGSASAVVQENSPSGQWPDGTQLDHFADRHSIVVFVQPNDPKSIENLEKLEQVARQRRVFSTVVFSKTGERELDEQSRQAVQRAQQIPNSNVVFDDRGRESERFGLFNTPSFSVYNPGGELVTSGDDLPSQSASVMNILPGNPNSPTYAGVSHPNSWSSSNHALD